MENSFEERHGHDHGHGEFGFILPMIMVPLAIGVMMKIARRQYHHMQAFRGETWKNGVPPMFAELHRRAHAAESQTQAAAEKTL